MVQAVQVDIIVTEPKMNKRYVWNETVCTRQNLIDFVWTTLIEHDPVKSVAPLHSVNYIHCTNLLMYGTAHM